MGLRASGILAILVIFNPCFENLRHPIDSATIRLYYAASKTSKLNDHYKAQN